MAIALTSDGCDLAVDPYDRPPVQPPADGHLVEMWGARRGLGVQVVRQP